MESEWRIKSAIRKVYYFVTHELPVTGSHDRIMHMQSLNKMQKVKVLSGKWFSTTNRIKIFYYDRKVMWYSESVVRYKMFYPLCIVVLSEEVGLNRLIKLKYD